MNEITPQEMIKGQKYYFIDTNTNKKNYGFFGGEIVQDTLYDDEYMVLMKGIDSIKNRDKSNTPTTMTNFELSTKNVKFYKPFSARLIVDELAR